MSEPTKQPGGLTPQKIRNLIAAHQKLTSLLQQQVVTKGSDEEKSGLANFIGNTMLEHAPEFIGCWNVVQGEYNPLVKGIAALLARANMLLAAHAQDAQAEATPKPQQEAENIQIIKP